MTREEEKTADVLGTQPDVGQRQHGAVAVAAKAVKLFLAGLAGAAFKGAGAAGRGQLQYSDLLNARLSDPRRLSSLGGE